MYQINPSQINIRISLVVLATLYDMQNISIHTTTTTDRIKHLNETPVTGE